MYNVNFVKVYCVCLPLPTPPNKKQEEVLFCQQSTGSHDKHITAASDVIYVCMHLGLT